MTNSKRDKNTSRIRIQLGNKMDASTMVKTTSQKKTEINSNEKRNEMKKEHRKRDRTLKRFMIK